MTHRQFCKRLQIIGGASIAYVFLLGCMSPGGEIRTAAEQTTFASFDAEGNLEISGDGTADFDVTASGNADGWNLTIKTKTSREAIDGTARIASDAFRAISSAIDRIQIPGVVGPPAPQPEPIPDP